MTQKFGDEPITSKDLIFSKIVGNYEHVGCQYGQFCLQLDQP